MYNFFFITLLDLEDIISSIPAFYEHTIDGLVITNNIIKTIHLFNDSNVLVYLDNSMNYKRENYPFLDNEYWNFWFMHKSNSYNNQFVWNYLNSKIEYNLNSNTVWLQLYSINLESFIWFNNEPSLFKLNLYNFYNNFYNVNFIDLKKFKHHDYQNDIYLCSNLFWQKHSNFVLPGFHLFWYENYGAVEIGLKVFWTDWYQILYPAIESRFVTQLDFNFLYNTPYYFQGLTTMVSDHTIKLPYTE